MILLRGNLLHKPQGQFGLELYQEVQDKLKLGHQSITVSVWMWD